MSFAQFLSDREKAPHTIQQQIGNNLSLLSSFFQGFFYWVCFFTLLNNCANHDMELIHLRVRENVLQSSVTTVTVEQWKNKV